MKREPLDMWAALHEGHPVCVTTNGFVRADGACVMGRGNAYEAKTRYPRLPYELGRLLTRNGNHVYYFPLYGLFTFPVKVHWTQEADLALIKRSAEELLRHLDTQPSLRFPVYLPSPGTGNGRLSWREVEPVLDGVFRGDPRVVIVVKPQEFVASWNRQQAVREYVVGDLELVLTQGE